MNGTAILKPLLPFLSPCPKASNALRTSPCNYIKKRIYNVHIHIFLYPSFFTMFIFKIKWNNQVACNKRSLYSVVKYDRLMMMIKYYNLIISITDFKVSIILMNFNVDLSGFHFVGLKQDNFILNKKKLKSTLLLYNRKNLYMFVWFAWNLQ